MTTEPQPGDETVFVVTMTLLACTFFSLLRSKVLSKIGFDLPISVFMFLFGMVIGGIMYGSEKFDRWLTITAITPKTIFHIFLPVLIFDGSQGLKMRALVALKRQVFLLACPGLLVHTAIVAVFMWIFTDDWSWWSRILFGGVLSATDPVAVIAVLKDLDADNIITTLIDGEAIANDGSAIIVFSVCYPVAAGHTEELSSAGFWILVVWLVVGSPIVGSIFSFIEMFFLRHAYNQPVVEAAILLAGSYVAFITAEEYIRVSGVLVLFTMGYHLATYRGARLSKHSELATHAWEVIVYSANAIIFALVGCIVGREAIPVAEAFDWALLFILYVALHVFRAAIVFGLWPWLQMSLPRAILLIFGALRGGVALTLALAIQRNHDFDERMRNRVLFLTGGTVILSIVFNGTVSKLLVKKLKLNVQPNHKIYLRQRLEAGLKYRALEAVRTIQGGRSQLRHFRMANWVEVYKNTVGRFRDFNSDLSVETGGTKSIRTIREEEFIYISLRAMKSKLWLMRESDFVSADAFQLLLSLLDEHLQKTDFLEPLVIQNAAMTGGFPIPFDVCGVKKSTTTLACEALMTYSEMLHAVDTVLLTMMPQSRRSAICSVGTETLKHMTDDIIKNMEDQHAEIVAGIQTNRVVLMGLRDIQRHLHELFVQQGIPRSAYNKTHNHIASLVHSAVHRDPLSIGMTSEKRIFANCMIFRQSSMDIVTVAFANSLRRIYRKGDPIYLQGLGVVLRGTVGKHEPPKNYYYYPSELFGLTSVLADLQPYGYTAKEDCVVAMIPDAVLLMLVNAQPTLLQEMWARYGMREAQIELSRYYPSCLLPRDDVRRISSNGVLRAYVRQTTISTVGRTVFLLHGIDVTGRFSHRSIRLLPHIEEVTFQSNTILFVIENYSMHIGNALPDSIGVPVIDTQMIELRKLMVSLREAVADEKDFVDMSLWHLMEYCKTMGCSLLYLLPHAEGSGTGKSSRVQGRRRSLSMVDTSSRENLSMAGQSMFGASVFGTSVRSPMQSSLISPGRTSSNLRGRSPLKVRPATQASHFAVQLALNLDGGAFVQEARHMPFGEDSVVDMTASFVPIAGNFSYVIPTPDREEAQARYEFLGEEVKPLDVAEVLDEWQSFCTMLQRLILERFHLHTLDARGLLNYVVWWYQKITNRLPQLALHFSQNPCVSIYTLEDLCTADDVTEHWRRFGFSFTTEELAEVDEEAIQKTLDELIIKDSFRRKSSMLISTPTGRMPSGGTTPF